MPTKLDRPNETIICGCGCGQTILRYSERGRERQFAQGHNTRGQTISPEQREKIAAGLRGKPSGMLGKRQTESAKQKMSASLKGRVRTKEHTEAQSQAMKRAHAEGRLKTPDNAGSARKGPRADLGNQNFRSAWEANIARWLNSLGVCWQFEPTVFRMASGDTYRPDFYLPDKNMYIEVRGRWWPKSRDRFEQFRAEYPHIRLFLIDRRRYLRLRKSLRHHLPYWEDFGV